MKRNRDLRLTPAERRSLYFLTAVLLAVFGLGWWLLGRQFEIVPPSEIAVRSGEDLRVPVAEFGPGKARIFRVGGQSGGPVRVFVKRQDHGRMVVTFGAAGAVTGRAARAIYQMDNSSVVTAGSRCRSSKKARPFPTRRTARPCLSSSESKATHSWSVPRTSRLGGHCLRGPRTDSPTLISLVSPALPSSRGPHGQGYGSGTWPCPCSREKQSELEFESLHEPGRHPSMPESANRSSRAPEMD